MEHFNLSALGFKNYSITKCGKIYSHISDKYIKPQLVRDYLRVGLYSKDENKRSSHYIHTLVAKMFVDGHEEGFVVNHKDGDKFNNNFENLEWVSQKDNIIHSVETGLRSPCFSYNGLVPTPEQIVYDYNEKEGRVGKPLSNEDEVRKCCELLEQGYRPRDVCLMTGLGRNNINRLKLKTFKKWEHITKDYDFSKIPNRRYTQVEDIVRVCEMIRDGLGCRTIAKETGLHISTVKGIKTKRSHSHISDKYFQKE